MIAGETPALEVDLRGHAATCARCRHELGWLESELRLFRYRAGRDEVHQLWQGVEQRSTARRSPGLSRAMLAFAASLLFLLGLGRMTMPAHPEQSAELGANVPMSVERDEALLQSSDDALSRFMSSEDPQHCSRLTPGLGFHCGSTQLASR